MSIIITITQCFDFKELYLEHNNLIKISETTSIDSLTNLKIITMSNNPWTCKCGEKTTVNFFQKYSSKVNVNLFIYYLK